MKQYDIIHSFGCSFTEGGGLNNPDYHEYINGNTFTNKFSKIGLLPEHQQYMKDNTYSSYLANLLKCAVVNHAESASSNELIFKKLYNQFKYHTANYSRTLVTVQTTILSRMLLNDIDNNKLLNLNNLNTISEEYVKEYYACYISRFYNREYEYNKLLQNIEIYTDWLRTKNVDVVWIMYETDSKPPTTRYFLNLDNRNLESFLTTNNLRICDLPDFPFHDTHSTEAGHKLVAERIYQHIENYD